MFNYKPNSELLSEYNEKVFGHLQAKKVLINLINRSRIRHNQIYGLANDSAGKLIEPSKVLLIGDSGTGKTFLVEQLKEMLDFPLLILDATQLTPSGNSDGVSQKKFKALITETVQDWVASRKLKGYTHSFEGASQQLVVFVDEIDKLACSFDSSGNWNRHVQSNFLTMFDNHGDGGGVSFIFAGAFTGLNPEVVTKSLGFFDNVGGETSPLDLDESVVKYGLIPELVGRLTSIVQLDKFTADDYERILREELVPAKHHHLYHFNRSYLEISSEDLTNMAKKAGLSGQGVRYLKRELDKLCLEIEFNYDSNPTSNSSNAPSNGWDTVSDEGVVITLTTEEEIEKFLRGSI